MISIFPLGIWTLMLFNSLSPDTAWNPFFLKREEKASDAARALIHPVIGYYTLDLTEANKGKVLEPVKVSLTADKKTVIVDQYTRKLPTTRIPVSGGTVDFDQRFGTGAKCGPFRAQE